VASNALVYDIDDTDLLHIPSVMTYEVQPARLRRIEPEPSARCAAMPVRSVVDRRCPFASGVWEIGRADTKPDGRLRRAARKCSGAARFNQPRSQNGVEGAEVVDARYKLCNLIGARYFVGMRATWQDRRAVPPSETLVTTASSQRGRRPSAVGPMR
jgi:hypothetical protein